MTFWRKYRCICDKIALIAVFISISASLSLAQTDQIYKTIKGYVVLRGAYKGQSVILASKNLFARINYQTAEILLSVDVRTFHGVTVPDTISGQLAASHIGISMLKGKMNIPYVQTLKHPDHKLKFEAEFQLNGIIKSIIVTGLLKHISEKNSFTCMLTLDFMIGLKDFGIIPPQGYSDQVYISISQAVLKPDNQ